MPEDAKREVEIDGQKVVVYDVAKVDTFIKEKETAWTTEKGSLETAAKEAADKLAKATEKDADFASLRTAKEEADKKLAEANEKHTKEVTELRSAPLKEHKTNLTKLFVGNDKDLGDKLEFHLSKTVSAMPEGTKEEIDAKLKAAYQLAIGTGYKEDFVSRVLSSAGGQSHISSGPVDAGLKEIGAKFGLSGKDFDEAQKKGLI